MKKITITLFLVFAANILFGQDYIVTLQYDTLYGEVELLLPSDKYEELVFNSDDNKKRLKAYQLLAASEDSAIYKPVKHAGKYRFMEEVINGYLGLYRFRLDGSYDFGALYLRKRTTDGLEVPNFSFKKMVSEFLNDCESIQAKIEDRTYRKADLEKIVKEYNYCINKVKTPENQEQQESNIAEEDVTKIELLQKIKNQVKGKKNEELLTLLNDIESKIKASQNVPGYLINALKSQTSDINEVTEAVDKLVAALN